MYVNSLEANVLARGLTEITAPARRIMSLTDPTKKMSKSDPNPKSRILITDSEETIRQKFRTALTDSQDGISYDPERRPGVSNLLDIFKHVQDDAMSSHDLATNFKDSSLRALKEMVADAVVKGLREVRERFFELRSHPENLNHDMSLDHDRASSVAEQTLLEVKEAMGLHPLHVPTDAYIDPARF